ncbi:ferredoxin [Arthrobacter sp. KNU40]|uniref:ferredoxin n=1 Tax=Arthrobacter sp. KNU40 TaxID=3447965 RepID=UPI003F5F10A2
MKLRVEDHLCTGHGRCYSRAPEVFQSDDDGFCDSRDEDRVIAPALERDARVGVRACPERAITILED